MPKDMNVCPVCGTRWTGGLPEHAGICPNHINHPTEPSADWFIAESDRLIEAQGWSRATVEALMQEYIDRTNPQGYRDFLRERAAAENEED